MAGKHHPHKLQQLMTTMSASRASIAPVDGRKPPPDLVAEGQDQHQRKLEQDPVTACNYNHYHKQPDQDQHGQHWSDWSNQCN